MSLIKSLLICDGREPLVVLFESGDIDEMYRLIGCDYFDCAVRKVGKSVYNLWVDDEGLYLDKNVHGMCLNAEEFLVGNILITRNDGEEIASLTDADIDEIKANLRYPNIDAIASYDGCEHFAKKGEPILIYSV